MPLLSPATRRLQRQKSLLFDSVTQLVPLGHEKPLRQAFYTAAAILFTVAGCAAALYVYFVLEIFIKPLIWAVLCGSFLFPFKYSLNFSLESWLNSNKESGTPLVVGAILIPVSLFDNFSEKLGKFVVGKWKILVAISTVMGLLYILHMIQLLYIFQLALQGLWQAVCFIWESTSASVDFFTQYRIIFMTLVAAYTIAVFTLDATIIWWLRYLAVPAWILLLICLVGFAGSMQVPFGIGLIALVITGAVSASKQNSGEIRRRLLQRASSITILLKSPLKNEVNKEDSSATSSNSPDEPSDPRDKKDDEVFKKDGKNDEVDSVGALSEGKKAVPESPQKHRKSTYASGRRGGKQKESSSVVFFNFLFFAFILMIAWMHTWVVGLLMTPFAYWCVKQIIYMEFVRKFCDARSQQWFGYDISTMRTKLYEHYLIRQELVFPPSVRSTIDMFRRGDKKVNSTILKILPTITTTIVILTLIIGTVSISFFFAIKIQQESFLLLQMTSDLIDETVSKHPDYQSWLPDNDTMQKSMNSIAGKVYLQGREWIKDQLHSNFGEEANVSLIEKQALKIWDRAYHSWFNKSIISERKLLFRRQSTENVLAQNDASTGLFYGVMDLLYMSEVIELLKENMSALVAVLESVWSVVQTNLGLIFSSLTTVITILLTGGTAVMNFVVSMVVFFTSLFYLLAASNHLYMPVQLIGIGGDTSANPGPFATAIQDAISGVFGASLKMASFYGLYTWLNHTICGAALVYIPSLLASIFSVVPVFTTYWACIPAFLELWLLQGDILRGLVLVILQFLPTMFVDAVIYSEMAATGGGHPYITGLAVAGGLYYFGLEGAIIGPILLCILLVAINIYFRIINMPSTEMLIQPPREMPTQVLRASSSEYFPERRSAS